MNKDTLKKHHFWILLGLIPLLVLIAVITISSSVGSAIAARQKEIDDANGQVKGKAGTVKGDDLINQMGKRVDVLAEKRTKLWQANWEQQRRLFTWPANPLLAKFNYDDKGNGPKFGTQNLPTASGEFDTFKRREVYLKEYERMAELVTPTQFGAGGGGPGGMGGMPGIGGLAACQVGCRRSACPPGGCSAACSAWPGRRATPTPGRRSCGTSTSGASSSSPPTRSGWPWRTSGCSGRCSRRSSRSTTRWPRSSGGT